MEAECTLGTGCPPVTINAKGLPSGKIALSGAVSSQYLTALLMAAPLSVDDAGVEITIIDELVSKPYVSMTIKLMEQFGVVVHQVDGLQKLQIPGNQKYVSPGSVFVEGDASSASYFLAGATITGSKIRVRFVKRSLRDGSETF